MNQIISAVSTALFSRNNKTTKKPKIQHPEPAVEKNLYTILGFKSEEDFKNKINKFVNKEIWQLFVDRFEKDIDDPRLKVIVITIITNLARNCNSSAYAKVNSSLLYRDQDSKEKRKATKKVFDILKKTDLEKAFKELSEVKEQAEDLVQTGAQLFAETLKYIGSLEKLSEVKKDELVEDFLLNHVKSLNKKSPNLRGKRIDAIKILSDSKLRKGYNWHVEAKIIDPIVPYREYTDLDSRQDNAKNELKEIVEKKDLEKGLETIDKLIVNAVNEIKKHRIAILNCKNFQNLYIKEKEEYPFRGKACQKMIDIYQTNIAGYQEKIYQSLNPISELLKSVPQKIKDLSDVKEFQTIVDGMHTEHNTQQAAEKIGLALICLANTRTKWNIQLEKMRDPSTELRASYINTGTEVTRL